MAEIEHPEKYNWWLNELDSRGISNTGEKWNKQQKRS
jgi:hypothetical protein